MEQVEVRLRDVVDNLGQIVSRDGGSLHYEAYDPATGRLRVSFRQAAENECVSCTIDAATVRMFLEEAVRAHGIDITSLDLRTG